MNLDLYHGYIIIQIFALVNTFMQIFEFILNVHKTKAIDLLKNYSMHHKIIGSIMLKSAVIKNFE